MNIDSDPFFPLSPYFIHPDHLNTPRAVYDDQQQLRWRWDQAEPFGVNMPDENPSALGTHEMPLRFPGQYGDKETNLSYNYFRDYDALTGRYVQSDPIGLTGGLNTYLYARGDSLTYIDPSGQNPFIVCLAALGGGFATGYWGPDLAIAVSTFGAKIQSASEISGSRASEAVRCASGETNACKAATLAEKQLVPAAGSAVGAGADVVKSVAAGRMAAGTAASSYPPSSAPPGNAPRYPNFPSNNTPKSGPYAPGYTR